MIGLKGQREAAQDWTESLEADGLKDSGVHHRASDGQRLYYRCGYKTGYSTRCGRRSPANAWLSARKTGPADPNRKSTQPRPIAIKPTVNVPLDGLAALTTTRTPPQ